MTQRQFEWQLSPAGWLVGRFAALDRLGVAHAVTSRRGPDVQKLRAQPQAVAPTIAAELGLEALAWGRQVHGDAAAVVSEPGPAGECDALATATGGLGLMAFSADCPLILLADASGPAVALAHTSWRSTVRRIVPRLINRMAAEFGTQPGDLVAGIAPSAGPCCYEVGADVAEAVRQEFGDGFADRSLRPTRRGKWMCDLWRANVEQLSAAGVATDRISVAGVCTICGRKNLPSYRREGDAAGRFVAVIGRP